MATAHVGIAPVLTPHTVGILADTYERDHLSEQALLLRRLVPFIQEIVQKYFVPLLKRPENSDFASCFEELSRGFEYYRLYLNIQLFSILAKENRLDSYERELLNSLGPLMKSAREINMNPDLVSAAVRDYIKIFWALSQPADGAALPNDQIIHDWLQAANRFDYAITAVFLVLEKSIPAPRSQDATNLLFACKESLLGLARAASKLVNGPLQQALLGLETPHVKIEAARDVMSPLEVAKQSVPQSPDRQEEMNWLARRKDLVERYGGQWIVLEGDQLIANDVDYVRARETATQKGIEHPFIFLVPSKETGAFVGV